MIQIIFIKINLNNKITELDMEEVIEKLKVLPKSSSKGKIVSNYYFTDIIVKK